MSSKSQKGFSLQNIIIASIIATIFGGMVSNQMWGSVDSAKVTTLASVIKEQKVVVSSSPDYDYDAINTDNNHDYLPELVEAGVLSPIPDVFVDRSALTWEVRKMLIQGHKRIFYVSISSTNPDDQELINEAIDMLSFNPNIVNVI